MSIIFLLLFFAVFRKTVAFQQVQPSSQRRLQQQSQLLEEHDGDDSNNSICLQKTAVWSEVRISTGELCTQTSETEALEHFQEGESVLLLKDLVSEEDCRALVTATARQLADHGTNKNGANNPVTRQRLPTIAAAKRAAASNTPCAESLNEEADSICQRILRRSVETIDEQLPSLSLALFGGKIEPLLTSNNNGLIYSSREPAVNVYTTGGQFLAHEDGQKLTVLVVLGCDSDFEGGGTAFWSPDSRGHRVEPPSLILRQKAGTAMLFAGHVTHAGLSLTSGCRVVFVASFSPKAN
jgi:hypothetical protein